MASSGCKLLLLLSAAAPLASGLTIPGGRHAASLVLKSGSSPIAARPALCVASAVEGSPNDSATLAQLRAFVREHNLDVKTAGPGRTKAVILAEIKEMLQAGGDAAPAGEAVSDATVGVPGTSPVPKRAPTKKTRASGSKTTAAAGGAAAPVQDRGKVDAPDMQKEAASASAAGTMSSAGTGAAEEQVLEAALAAEKETARQEEATAPRAASAEAADAVAARRVKDDAAAKAAAKAQAKAARQEAEQAAGDAQRAEERAHEEEARAAALHQSIDAAQEAAAELLRRQEERLARMQAQIEEC